MPHYSPQHHGRLVNCPSCRGGGSSVSCDFCRGKGETKCGICDGSRYDNGKPCTYCYGRGFNPCEFCHRTGVEDYYCSLCDSTGLLPENEAFDYIQKKRNEKQQREEEARERDRKAASERAEQLRREAAERAEQLRRESDPVYIAQKQAEKRRSDENRVIEYANWLLDGEIISNKKSLEEYGAILVRLFFAMSCVLLSSSVFLGLKAVNYDIRYGIKEFIHYGFFRVSLALIVTIVVAMVIAFIKRSIEDEGRRAWINSRQRLYNDLLSKNTENERRKAIKFATQDIAYYEKHRTIVSEEVRKKQVAKLGYIFSARLIIGFFVTVAITVAIIVATFWYTFKHAEFIYLKTKRVEDFSYWNTIYPPLGGIEFIWSVAGLLLFFVYFFLSLYDFKVKLLKLHHLDVLKK